MSKYQTPEFPVAGPGNLKNYVTIKKAEEIKEATISIITNTLKRKYGMIVVGITIFQAILYIGSLYLLKK